MQEVQRPENSSAELPAMPLEARESSEPRELAEREEDAPMLDVHPPHEPIHTWKAYLLHMSTIVLGLLIAIALEQSVEAVHRSSERKDLRESLQRESERALADAEQTEQIENDPLRWITARRELIEKSLDTHQPLPPQLPRKPHISSNMPIDPAWGAAKSSGLLHLLTQQEVEAYSEVDLLFTGLQDTAKIGRAASYKRSEFEERHRIDPLSAWSLDLSHATPEQLNTYHALLDEEYSAWDDFRVGCEYLRGEETAIVAGERDLRRIQIASRQFYSVVPRDLTPKDVK